MTLSFQNFDGAPALDDVQQLQGVLGTGIGSGCAASLASDTSPITIDVASGTAFVSNSEIGFGGASIELPDGDSQHPRKDVVYIDSAGLLQSLQGTPREPQPRLETARDTYQPEPPDLSSLSSIADAAVVATVWVPAGATSTSDMADSGIEYVRDRRLRPWAESVLTGDNIQASDLAFDPATQTELNTHISDDDAHHTPYTDEMARDAAGAMATDGLSYDDPNDELGLNVVATGSVSISAGGSATVDTGVSGATTATFSVYLGPTDGTQDSEFAADIRNDSSTGNYVVEIQETDTSGGGTVEYDVVRLR